MTLVREPLQIVELTQPRCANKYGCGFCTAGLGEVADTDLGVNFALDPVSDYVGTEGTDVARIAGGVNVSVQPADTALRFQTVGGVSSGFDGDDARFITISGRVVDDLDTPNWTLFYTNDSTATTFNATRSMTPVNLNLPFRGVTVSSLKAGDEFTLVYDASDSDDYATEWLGKTIDNFRLDIADGTSSGSVDLYSISVSSGNLYSQRSEACFNTRATCQDIVNYRDDPWEPLTTSNVYEQDETVPALTVTQQSQNVLLVTDVSFLDVPEGVIFEIGGNGIGAYMGVSSGGDLVFRAGDGATPSTTTMARFTTSVTPYINRTARFLWEIDTDRDTINIWEYDIPSKTLSLLGTATASAGFPSGQWGGTDAGGVGTVGGSSVPDGETVTDFTGLIGNVQLFFNTLLPASENEEYKLLLQYVGANANRPTTTGYDPSAAVGSLESVRMSPTVLNVASGDLDYSPLGLRAVANISMRDHPYNDAGGLDPYMTDRSYNIEANGTYWGRWVARNPYHTGMRLRLFDGFRGDTLNDMIRREYFIDKIDRNRNGVRIVAKDVLRFITDAELKVPAASTGVLSSNITAGASSFTVAGGSLDDYPLAGGYVRVRIGDEIIQCSNVAPSGGNLSFTVAGGGRGNLDTQADSHDSGDAVQFVYPVFSRRFDLIIYELLVNEAGIPANFIKFADWRSEAILWRPTYIFNRFISEPTDVHKLVGELVQQAQTHIWWDERLQTIRMEAQRANAISTTLTQEGNIVENSLSLTEDTKDRASRVDVYYGLRNPTKDPSKKSSYRASEVVIDVDSATNYGEISVKEIFAPWIDTAILARSLATNYVARFKDVRKRVKFDLTAKDIEDVWTGDVVAISHWLMQSANGKPSVRPWIITSAETVEHGTVYRIVAEDNQSTGVLWEWVAEADYPLRWEDASPTERATVGYWCDSNGNDLDGNPSPFRWL